MGQPFAKVQTLREFQDDSLISARDSVGSGTGANRDVNQFVKLIRESSNCAGIRGLRDGNKVSATANSVSMVVNLSSTLDARGISLAQQWVLGGGRDARPGDSPEGTFNASCIIGNRSWSGASVRLLALLISPRSACRRHRGARRGSRSNRRRSSDSAHRAGDPFISRGKRG